MHIYLGAGWYVTVYYDTNQYTNPHGNSKSRKTRDAQRGADYSASLPSGSAGAHSTQRPVAFPLATCSTILGCEQVTACVAEILFIIYSKLRARRKTKVQSHLILSDNFASRSPLHPKISRE